jgi:hypothetical protein
MPERELLSGTRARFQCLNSPAPTTALAAQLSTSQTFAWPHSNHSRVSTKVSCLWWSPILTRTLTLTLRSKIIPTLPRRFRIAEAECPGYCRSDFVDRLAIDTSELPVVVLIKLERPITRPMAASGDRVRASDDWFADVGIALSMSNRFLIRMSVLETQSEWTRRRAVPE